MLSGVLFKNRLLSLGIEAEAIRGMSDAEIRKLEQSANVRFPEWYFDFLRVAGRGAGGFLADVTMFYPDIQFLTERVREDLSGILELPSDAFVFADRMGEVFLYFRGTGDPNAPIFRWSEGKQAIQELSISFWEFVEEQVVETEKRKKQ